MLLLSLTLKKHSVWVWLLGMVIGTSPALSSEIALSLEGREGLMAHKVELSGTVGGTLHIEPNDTPTAGQAHLTWFAITRQGGAAIALADCDCQLSVYQQPYQEGSPLQTPPLRAIVAEGYENIPGADITFPQVGAYDLVLRGRPKASDDFEPFELKFSVTVAAGQAASPSATTGNAAANSPIVPSAESNPNPSTDRASFFTGLAIAVGIFGVGAIATISALRRRSK